MTLEQLIPELASLTRTEKFRVVQSLISELASVEDTPFESHRDYEVWSPYRADEAAATLLDLLRAEGGADVER